MPDPLVIDLFCEDQGHRSLVEPLVRRIVRECRRDCRVQVMTARGGTSRLFPELNIYTSLVKRNVRRRPDLLIVVIDGNCVGHEDRVEQIRERLGAEWDPQLVPAVPHAHIERWYLADQTCVSKILGSSPVAIPDKCERGIYKDLLAGLVKGSGVNPVSGGTEFGPEIAESLDIFRAGKADPSFKNFVNSLTNRLRQLPAPE